MPPGSYASAAIILLTDGQTTTGPDPSRRRSMAADRGVRVYTVGVGTQAGEMIGAEGWSMRVRLDEEALKTIANLTRGEYFYAGTATDLQKIYQNLNTKLFFEQKETEITALFAAAAALAGARSALCRCSGSAASCSASSGRRPLPPSPPVRGDGRRPAGLRGGIRVAPSDPRNCGQRFRVTFHPAAAMFSTSCAAVVTPTITAPRYQRLLR